MRAILAPPGLLAYNGSVESQPTSPEKPQGGAESLRLCVYTALFGGYEKLNEQPVALQSKIPFVCFTDDAGLQSETWQTRTVSPLLPLDSGRSQREVKMRPREHLPEFDISLYIDNAVLLTQPPELIFERYPSVSGFCLARQSARASVLDEFLEVVDRGLDDQSRVFEQLTHYSLICPQVLEEQPFWGGILLRDHRQPKVLAMLEIWLAHVLRYSRRDQLSVNAAFRQAGLKPTEMDIAPESSWFHAWPITIGRGRERGSALPLVSYRPPVARVRQLERSLAEVEQLLWSDAGRVGRQLNELAKRRPLLVGPVLRVIGRLARRKESREGTESMRDASAKPRT